MIRIVRAPKEYLEESWNLAQEHIQGAVDRSNERITLEDVWNFVKTGEMQLWLIINGEAVQASVVTELVNYPSKRVCRVALAGGTRRKDWMGLIVDIEEWARGQSCVSVELYIRKGLAKDLPEYKLQQVVLEKEL